MHSKSISNPNAELSVYKDSNDKFQYPTLAFRWNNVLSHLKHYLFNPHEPHVWQQYDSSGRVRWCAYDPQTQQSAYCFTEDEMRNWLDQLHY